LLELFADTDPLVREISLRGLQHIGGQEAKSALVKLLGDPEPNVRAAVLKQLEEAPDVAMVPAVVKYLKEEKDPDLIVHGIGFLRATKGKEAMKCLMSLLKHKSWQVRAEAAAGIGKLNDRSGVHYSFDSSVDSGEAGNNSPAMQLQVDAYIALLDLLDDEDGFVVAKAVEGLADADMALAVEPLVKVATKHPELAANVLTMLAGKSHMRQKAIPHLQKFCKHEKPQVRAAAIAALCTATSDVGDEVLAALGDKESDVRIAAASSLFQLMDRLREAAKSKPEKATADQVTITSTVVLEGELTDAAKSLLSKALGSLGGSVSPAVPAPVPAIAPKTSSDKKTVENDDDAKTAKATPKPKAAKDGKEVSDAKTAKKGKPNDKKNAPVKKTDEDENPQDRWLADCYAGRGRPKWTSQTLVPLEKMLKAGNARERVAAGLALVPLGKAPAAAPVVLDTVRANHDLMETAAKILPWLVWKDRVKMFRDLSSLASDGESRARLIAVLAEAPDHRAAELLWELLAGAKVTDDEASSIYGALMVTYLGNQYYSSSNVSAADRRDLAKAAKPRVEAGSERQRLPMTPPSRPPGWPTTRSSATRCAPTPSKFNC
jgi:HEAT repeat protein